MNSIDVASNISRVLTRVREAEAKYDREPHSVGLLAVSKTKPASMVQAAFEAGQRAFGENYLQDALEKIETLSELPLEWHFIGPIQSNKTRPIAANFAWVHSVDRLKIAHRLSEQRPLDLPPLNICLQINISGEDSKSGISPSELDAMAAEISQLPNLKLRGLMAIPAPADSFEQQSEPLKALKQLFDRLNAQGLALDTLSMGMSSDLEAAVAEGSTMVRIGTDIFGAR